MSGELVVTTLSLLTPKLNPMFSSFLDTYPDINLRILSDERVFKLEYGEAHLAIRLGKMPDESFKKFSSLNFRELATMAPTSTLEPLAKITPFGFIRITLPFASRDP